MGNIFLSSDETQAGFIDYQCVCQDHCMRDVNYHLVNSCPAEDLGGIEKELLSFYLEKLRLKLQAKGLESEVPSYDDAYFLYRSHSMWSLLSWVVCCGFSDVVMEEFAVSSLQRVMDTCHRLDVLQAVSHSLSCLS